MADGGPTRERSSTDLPREPLRSDIGPDTKRTCRTISYHWRCCRPRHLRRCPHCKTRASSWRPRPLGWVRVCIRWSGEFCLRLPDDLLWVENPVTGERIQVVPGEWCIRDVKVGHHTPMSAELVLSFMGHFDRGYSGFRPATAIIAAASANRRLAWIHLFMDGNGRTARLHSHAFLLSSGARASAPIFGRCRVGWLGRSNAIKRHWPERTIRLRARPMAVVPCRKAGWRHSPNTSSTPVWIRLHT